MSSFLDDIVFSHNGPYGMWHWQYLHQCLAGASGYKFLMYSLGGTMLTMLSYTVAADGTPGAKSAVYDCLVVW